MEKSDEMVARKAVLDSLLLPLPGVATGKMFGCDAWFVNGRMFACLYGDGMGVKIPEGDAAKLLEEGRAVPFQPYGKARMREWVQLCHADAGEFRGDMDLLRLAVTYVAGLPQGKKRKK